LNTLSRFALVATLSALVTGCIYVDGEYVDRDDWRDAQDHNREAISQLKLGTASRDVVADLGTPDDSEAFTDNGAEVRVLFYRTTRRHADGETSRDETTPLVFRDGLLVGWGKEAYRNARQLGVGE